MENELKWKCGCEHNLRDLGRGKARLLRMEQVKQSVCPKCAKQSRVELAYELTYLGGGLYSTIDVYRYLLNHKLI